ncbi:MAG: hypothetical protein A2Z20_01660 [Bdellovibrionales bacterium RBG_16_40_8]|nr:MAG: hypothetical protein A2Z20_01660 [Bdellovibrionales bacterium RBG_16_40_8]
MRRIFIYSPLILKRLAEFAEPEDKARQIENELLNNPESGDVVPATGGVRKFRLPDEGRGKGKRGGIRVFFLDLPHVEKIHLLYLLRKGESTDLAADEKKLLRDLVLILKRESKP